MFTTTLPPFPWPNFQAALEQAEIEGRKPIYTFTESEKKVLAPFFTNCESRVFFLKGLPANVQAGLIAMYSRIKNERGLRGVFCDSFIPTMLVSNIDRFADDERTPLQIIKAYGVNCWDDFLNKVPGAKLAAKTFLAKMGQNETYFTKFASAKRVRMMLSQFLDSYGHNSIARAGSVTFCLEKISLLAAKAVEWCRPGAAYIELSTRYVSMSSADVYRIPKQLEVFTVDTSRVEGLVKECFRIYRKWDRNILANFLTELFRKLVKDEKDLTNGVNGAVADLLGNCLPLRTLTSVGAMVSGETLNQLIQILWMEKLPETWVLADMILEEAQKVGADQFTKRHLPSAWNQQNWTYLTVDQGSQHDQLEIIGPGGGSTAKMLWQLAKELPQFAGTKNWNECVKRLKTMPRTEFDKLPAFFEAATFTVKFKVTIRGWRDFQRHVMFMHLRQPFTAFCGFYKHPLPCPKKLAEDLDNLHRLSIETYEHLMERGVPPELAQYILPMGHMVECTMTGNLRQWEFALWQRTGHSVNPEVRKITRDIQIALANHLKWWREVSRATKEEPVEYYVFARTKEGIPYKE